MPNLASWSTFQSRDRKGIEQTQLSNDSGKHFLQIVYSQNFVFEEKRRTTLLSLDIFSPPSSSPLWYFYIRGASLFLVLKSFEESC